MSADTGRHPLHELLERAEADSRPVTALVELTHACNVDCEHCYLDLQPDKKIGALDTAEWKRIFDELAQEGCLFLTLSGGEVLIRRDWEELAKYARSLGFAVRFYTNGTLITEEVADRIAAIRPMGVEISLLGGISATHDAIARRRGAFEKTIAGVKRLRARGIKILLKCVLMKKNVGERAQIQALADALGCEMLFDIEVTPKNDGSRAPTELTAEGEAMLEAARVLYGGPLGAPDPREELLAAAPCAAGRRTVHIGPTGDVFPCTSWTKPIGNIRHRSFREIWHESPMFKEIRAKRIGSFPTCTRCDLLDVCNPCMALSVLEVGNLGGPSPTKCRATEMRAAAKGVSGEAAGFKEGLFSRHVGATPSTALVQLHRKTA